MNKKIGRNEPCPCGSGKKYKKCCMGKNDTFIETPEIENCRRPDFSKSGLEDVKPNPELWSLIHVNGKDPAKCTCDDCADANVGCSKDKNPKYCSETSLMGEPEFGSF
jgi:hypothetical protein